MSSFRRDPVLASFTPSNPNLPNVSSTATKKRRIKSKSSARSTKKEQIIHVAKESYSEQSVQEGPACPRDNIRVLVRIRPRNAKEKSSKTEAGIIVKAIDLQTVLFDQKEEAEEFYFHGVKQKDLNFMKRRNKDLTFGFDYVFGPSRSNVEIFESSLKNIVTHVINGYNCSVFAYGATGSGKTYTMLGSSENPGLTFLMAKDLSRKIKEIAHEYESEILVSYLEIYNEALKDLLHPTASLSIREDGLNGVNVPNLTRHKIQDTSELLSMLSQGNSRRTQHPTDHNAESSRSHAVFQVFVELRRRITQSSLGYHLVKAKLVMVDLAGSERGATNGPNSDRCREGANINKSLLALGNCINALADGKKHVPFRDSKLTRLLKDSLGGNCITVMIANVSPTFLNYDDTYNTLKYADRAKEIKVHYRKNVSHEPTGNAQFQKMIAELQMENSALKAELQNQLEINNNLKAAIDKEKYTKALGCVSSDASGFVPPVQKIHDPSAMEQFIHLIGQKKKLEEAHVDASINAKEAEWVMLWKRWRIQTITGLGKLEGEPFHAGLDRLRHQFENFNSNHIQCKEKVQRDRILVHFNDKEIDVTWKTLGSLKMEDPFVTLTLREFLNYTCLEREVGTHKCVENYHQKMCSRILDELVNTEFILSESFRFIQFLNRGILDPVRIQAPIRDKKYKALLSRLYKDSSPMRSDGTICTNKKTQNAIFPEDLIEALRQVIQHPVVEYEPPAIEDGTRSRLDVTDSSGTSITPMRGSEVAVVSKGFHAVATSSQSSDIVARKSISDFILKTKTVAPPPVTPRAASSSRGSDSDCHSLPFSFTQQSSRKGTENAGKTSSETSIESHPGQRAPSNPRSIKNQSSNSRSSTSEDNLLMSLKQQRQPSVTTASEDEYRVPLKRTQAGLTLQPDQTTTRKVTQQTAPLPNRVNQRLPIPPPQRRPPTQSVDNNTRNNNVPERISRHQIQEPDLSSRREKRHQVELVQMKRRKRREESVGDEGSGDCAERNVQPSLTQFWSSGQEEVYGNGIIAPPTGFANAEEELADRSQTYYVFNSPPTPVYTDNEFMTDDDEDGFED